MKQYHFPQLECIEYEPVPLNLTTVIILNIGTDRSEQTVQTQIRLLLKEQSDQGLLCLLFCLHLLNTILHCKIQLFQLQYNYGYHFRCPNFRIFTVDGIEYDDAPRHSKRFTSAK